MKKFLIHVSTNWCGMDFTYKTEAESEFEIEDTAMQLAYDNFSTYGCQKYIAEEYDYNPEFMTEEDWNELWEQTSEEDYYGYNIKEFTGTNEEWEEYDEV